MLGLGRLIGAQNVQIPMAPILISFEPRAAPNTSCAPSPNPGPITHRERNGRACHAECRFRPAECYDGILGECAQINQIGPPG